MVCRGCRAPAKQAFMSEAEDVVAFWFPPGLDADQAAHARQFQFWFGGGANAGIAQRFAGIHEAAARGALDAWAETPRGRVGVDRLCSTNFSRSLHGGTASAYAQDERAIGLPLTAWSVASMKSWRRTGRRRFSSCRRPFGAAGRSYRCMVLADALISEAPVQVRASYEFSASQARGHREVVVRLDAVISQRRPGPGVDRRRAGIPGGRQVRASALLRG